MEVESVSRICRVLIIESLEVGADGAPATDAAKMNLDDCLRVLLPLQVDDNGEAVADPIGELEGRLPQEIERQTKKILLAASAQGKTAVSVALGDLLTKALQPGVPD